MVRHVHGREGGPVLLAAMLAIAPLQTASAGPPYLSDDPQPTDLGHWEIYNFVTGVRDSGGLGGDAGLDLNYGGARDIQLTAVLPLAFDNPRGARVDGLRAGPGDVELAVKDKILHQSKGSWTPDVAVFPRLFAPSGGTRFGTGHLQLLLPVWAEKDVGTWQVFGGGGYQINPGTGQRDFWQGGIAVAHDVGKRLNLGLEYYAQGDNAVTGGGYQALNFAVVYKLVEHWSVLASGGPARENGGGRSQVFYLALKADY